MTPRLLACRYGYPMEPFTQRTLERGKGTKSWERVHAFALVTENLGYLYIIQTKMSSRRIEALYMGEMA